MSDRREVPTPRASSGRLRRVTERPREEAVTELLLNCQRSTHGGRIVMAHAALRAKCSPHGEQTRLWPFAASAPQISRSRRHVRRGHILGEIENAFSFSAEDRSTENKESLFARSALSVWRGLPQVPGPRGAPASDGNMTSAGKPCCGFRNPE
ncbi:unnamed protein product [Lampetra fluviatilis]